MMTRFGIFFCALVAFPLAALAGSDCDTVEAEYLAALSQRDSAQIQALKAELFAELEPSGRWMQAVETYYLAAMNITMSSAPETIDPQDAAVLIASERAMECWNVQGDVPQDLIDQSMVLVHESFPPDRRVELSAIARGMLE